MQGQDAYQVIEQIERLQDNMKDAFCAEFDHNMVDAELALISNPRAKKVVDALAKHSLPDDMKEAAKVLEELHHCFIGGYHAAMCRLLGGREMRNLIERLKAY